MTRAWWAMAMRRRWIAALIGFLALAALFAALGQWQMGRAIEQATIPTADTENPVRMDTVIAPGEPLSLVDGGQRVTVQATWTREMVVVSDAHQGERVGEWLVANSRTANGACLPVVVGWAERVDPSSLVVIDDSPSPLAGRIVGSDDPTLGEYDTGRLTVVSAADLANRWRCTSIYDAYLVLDAAPAPLETVSTATPLPQASLNWLNIFYAVEWSVFALFALYFWYRLVADAVEREAESAVEARP